MRIGGTSIPRKTLNGVERVPTTTVGVFDFYKHPPLFFFFLLPRQLKEKKKKKRESELCVCHDDDNNNYTHQPTAFSTGIHRKKKKRKKKLYYYNNYTLDIHVHYIRGLFPFLFFFSLFFFYPINSLGYRRRDTIGRLLWTMEVGFCSSPFPCQITLCIKSASDC